MAGLSCGVTVKKHNRHKKQDLRKIEDEKYTIIHVPFYLIFLCLRGLKKEKPEEATKANGTKNFSGNCKTNLSVL